MKCCKLCKYCSVQNSILVGMLCSQWLSQYEQCYLISNFNGFMMCRALCDDLNKGTIVFGLGDGDVTIYANIITLCI